MSRVSYELCCCLRATNAGEYPSLAVLPFCEVAPAFSSRRAKEGQLGTSRDTVRCKRRCKQEAEPNWPGLLLFLSTCQITTWEMGATGLEPVTPSVSKCSYTPLSFAVFLVKSQGFSLILPTRRRIASHCKKTRRIAYLRIVCGNFLGTYRERGRRRRLKTSLRLAAECHDSICAHAVCKTHMA